jgi:CRISPR/Cas system-associated exonuclease Cas4 (RecB family)
MVRVVTSTSAAARLDAVARFLGQHPPAAEIVVIGASRGAADDLARRVARAAGATFGIARFSLTELAARAAAARLAGAHRVPGTQTGAEATAARAVFDAVAAGDLHYFAPVATLPGFPKALARTVHELRLAGITPEELGRSARSRPPAAESSTSAASADIGRLLAHVEEQLEQAAVTDRAALFRLAAQACADGQVRWAALPLVLLDVPLDSHAEREFVAALIQRSPAVLATVPDGDRFALDALTGFGAAVDVAADPAPLTTDLANLRRYVFTTDRPDPRPRAGDVSLFSAPGEGREAVEIVRRVLDEAARGVPFDEMAVFLRTPRQYLGLLEHACARGGVPAYFDRGTRRPDPAGRAFVALLSCACEGMSAKRFDEYLSLGQVPQIPTHAEAGRAGRAGRAGGAGEAGGAGRAGEAGQDWTPPVDEVFRWSGIETEPDAEVEPDHGPDSDDEAVIAGTLRSPWKWEELIVESAVVGGRSRADGNARWRRRLDGLAADYRYRIAELKREEPESARIGRFERDLRNLAHLRAFALPIVDAIAEWPERATWGDWLDRFTALAAAALRRPARVLQLLAELRPMADVGPVTLDEARDVLHDRLVSLDWEPPPRRYGRLFVGTPHQARGRTFRVVFVPGLAERVVPQRPREDPLLLDAARNELFDSAQSQSTAPLVRQEERGTVERLLLKIAIGAAGERLYLSYPRLDVAETRARVPSFYALDVMRAITGEVPDHRVLAAGAAEEAGASLGWPAPADASRAIDDLEHDLASLKPLLDSRDPASVKGHAHYLLALNDALRRSVIGRWARGRGAWSAADGLMASAPGAKSALEAHRLGRRRYSLSALQRFATCPYQFLLATIYRLEPWDEPEPIVRMDPLTRGSLFHRAQAEFYRALKAERALPVTHATLPSAVIAINAVLDRVAAEYAEDLAPAIERVWRDEIDDLRRDLGIWVQKLADDSEWQPQYFEFSFGLSDEGRDPASLPDAVTIDGRFVLHGSVDLVERHRDLGVLRITDHKTGRNRSNPDLIVGGGSVLQPVLYSMAVEQGLGTKVIEGRLFYCTTVGGFADHRIPINDYTRRQGLEVLTIIDRAVEQGFLPAAPGDRACTWCDFRSVCGPREEERTARKSPDRLADLIALRAIR